MGTEDNSPRFLCWLVLSARNDGIHHSLRGLREVFAVAFLLRHAPMLLPVESLDESSEVGAERAADGAEFDQVEAALPSLILGDERLRASESPGDFGLG